jgi:hypothetical protein
MDAYLKAELETTLELMARGFTPTIFGEQILWSAKLQLANSEDTLAFLRTYYDWPG